MPQHELFGTTLAFTADATVGASEAEFEALLLAAACRAGQQAGREAGGRELRHDGISTGKREMYMTQRSMKRLGAFLGVLVLAVAALSMTAKAQSGLSGFSLGQSTGGVLVQKDFNGVTGSLGISFEDGCTATLLTGCTFSDITGSVGLGGNPVASYTLDFNSTPFLANFNGPGSWLFSAGDTSGYNLVGLGGGVNGTITWLTLNESLAGADSITGSATFTGTGVFSGLGSGTAAITLNLNALSCANLSSGTPCTLTGVSLDPPAPAGFATFGGTFGGGSTGGQTPEPGTLLLLGSGLTGIGFLRRRLWA